MPISRSSKNLNILIGLAVLVLSLSSCYENVEGCLDPNSTNYSIAADVDCEDCCTYPILYLLVDHRLGDISYNNTDTFTNDIGADFVIEDIKTYFSDVVLSDDLDEYRIEETFDFMDVNGEDQVASDDIVLATKNGFRYALGTFTEANDYNNLTIGLGIPEKLDLAQSITVTSDHPLVQAGDSLYVNLQNKYVNSWITLRQVGVHTVVDTLQITSSDYTFVFDNLLISQELGASLDINIKIDYAVLISGIDYNTMNKAEILDRVGENLKVAITPNF